MALSEIMEREEQCPVSFSPTLPNRYIVDPFMSEDTGPHRSVEETFCKSGVLKRLTKVAPCNL